MTTIDNNYIILEMVQVSQLQNGLIFTGKIKFQELNRIFRLTERKENETDPFDNSTLSLISDNEEFQRQLSRKKLNEIQNYLQKELLLREKGKSLGMFPSSLILYNRAYEADDIINLNDNSVADENIPSEELINNSYRSNLDCCFYIPNQASGIFKLYIPNNPNTTLIVDGQHRFVGTKEFYDSLKDEQHKSVVENFEFIVTFLVGFDIYEVGQIFATVNFNQKPVNRSLYYDIFGSAPQTDRNGNLQNDIRLAHELALHLNNNETSPINGMIKLLGKGYGLFSQSFFVEKLLRVFRTGIWDDLIIDYINGGKEYKKIAQFMRAYFAALKESYTAAWPERINKDGREVYSNYAYGYILCKTTGLGAYFRLIRFVYSLVKDIEPEDYKAKILSIFSHISDREAADLFAKSGRFGGAGSEGLQDKLFRYLISKYELDKLQ